MRVSANFVKNWPLIMSHVGTKCILIRSGRLNPTYSFSSIFFYYWSKLKLFLISGLAKGVTPPTIYPNAPRPPINEERIQSVIMRILNMLIKDVSGDYNYCY
jgi:hypothetical protein